MTETKNEKKKIEKKAYVTPEIKKHKAAAIVSGSGCSYYKSSSSGTTYYY